MSGDHSRDSFDALRDYAGVFLQQGRPVLDSDWNEMVRVIERRIRAATVDTIGRAIIPRETIHGFEIRATADHSLEIGRGRLYLDGMLLECHGAANFPGSGNTDMAAPVFDRARRDPADEGPEGVLDELISADGSDFLAYEDQPYWPNSEAIPEGNGPHLVYLVAWQREVTPLEEPDLLEPALGGIDTTTRWQTVWQVRVLSDIGQNVTCETPEVQLEKWQRTIAPSTARLTTGTVNVEDPEDPCLIPPTDGYTGLENQYYRVQLHSVCNDQTDARFKFSRENASVTAAIESFDAPSSRITLSRIGRDDLLRFQAGNWVEITDDNREFDHRSGQMLYVDVVNEETREIELVGTIDADLVPSGVGGDTAQARRSRLIRWDQKGQIRRTDTKEVWADLDLPGSDGLIGVPPAGVELMLESGVTVSFSTAAGTGGFREMDAWSFWARTAGTQIQILTEAPPQSVQRHYTKLAVFTFPGFRDDCREFWPPLIPTATGEGCACTVCVTPESHRTGELTIQMAIDSLPAVGGTVCLAGGYYALDEPVRIQRMAAVTLTGQGMGTVVGYAGSESAIEIAGSIDVQVERLSILAVPGEDTNGNIPPAHGITATNSVFLALRRLAVLVGAFGEARNDHGISLDGLAIGAKIEECLIIAPFGIGSFSAVDPENPGPNYLGLAEFRALDNIVFSSRAAIRFTGTILSIAGVTMARNLLIGLDNAIRLNWFELPTGATSVEGNTIFANLDAAVFGVTDLRLQDNEISGGPNNGDGVRLVPNVLQTFPTSAQIIGNHISDLAGSGIAINGVHDALLIKRNMIRRCGLAGILTAHKAIIRHIAIENNVIENISGKLIENIPNMTKFITAVGIGITRALEGQVIGNSIQAVGRTLPSTSVTAGIAMQGLGAMSIAENTIYQIGPDLMRAQATAIMVRPPYFQLSVQSNRLNGVALQHDGSTGWMAIEIGEAGLADQTNPVIDMTAPLTGLMANIPGMASNAMGFAVVGEVLYSFSEVDHFAIGQLRASQVIVHTNQVFHAAQLGRAMVSIVETSASAVGFSHNQLEIVDGADTAVETIVLIGAPRITAASNVVRHQSDSLSMLLSTSEKGSVTPMGNITTRSIMVVPGGLNPPFKDLNLMDVN